MMNEQELRVWAIERAINFQGSDGLLVVARSFLDFVNGTNDAEVLHAARELADKVKD